MIIDLHVHVADPATLPTNRKHTRSFWLSRYLDALHHQSTDDSNRSGESTPNTKAISRLAKWVQRSQVDRAVLLALDAVFDESGKRCLDRTMFYVSNEFVRSIASEHPEFMFGASIHPYRHDAIAKLDHVVSEGACLMKWIPSAQRIQPDDPRCHAFYEALAHYKIPLLSHTGVEHTLGRSHSAWNHPQRLVPALKRGVTVIAAHCGTRMFLHEPSFFESWASLAQQYENLYGDLGALPIVTRVPALTRALANKELCDRMTYGSDFPGIPSPYWCWQLGIGRMRELSRIDNPLERNLRVMQALNVPSNVFRRAGYLLQRGVSS